MTNQKNPVQLSLEVSLRDDATFANFYHHHSIAVAALKSYCSNLGDQSLLIWGGYYCGLTHLLQACNHSASMSGITIQYIPLAEVINYSPEEVLDGMESASLVCLDDIHLICGNQNWERGVFHFYNRLRDLSGRLLMSSHLSPALLDIQLADLKSRICGSVVYHIPALTDEDKAKALQMRAHLRGLDMSEEVTKYILSRTSRDTAKLFQLLHQLDKASLQQQRKLTIPFIKNVLKLKV